ncbi:ABC transporter ATP-binding protein [Sagittula stellata E-37]|uniref:ABC transporter ATP-binding protein n=1 Tax=Sagittula stellata (strain ATCC 700073 / DSM 11524 / E-37) TaxID=388399 RepID=A3K7Q3_SAGS3|nr:ABC transporter ATP-binding protein [Sagittula stellata E-37]
MLANAPLDASTAKISCRGLWKIFGPLDASHVTEARSVDAALQRIAETDAIAGVAGVDLDIREGEVFTLMGLSGSGKSTLLRCLAGLIEPSVGTLEYDGQDLIHMGRGALRTLRRNKTSMVFQNFALLPNRTVLGNIELPLEIQGLDKARRRARALEMIELVGLAGRESHYPSELSGGQQQRVGIARSLTTDPELWFLDEPFSALDPLIRRQMQDELLRLQAQLRKTVVFVTHDFDEAVKISDRIAIMRNGRIEQCDTAINIIANPANDYIREFVSDVDWTRVVTVGDVTAPGPAEGVATTIPAGTTLRDAARNLLDSNGPWAVTDDAGRTTGVLTRQALSGALERSVAQQTPERGRAYA